MPITREAPAAFAPSATFQVRRGQQISTNNQVIIASKIQPKRSMFTELTARPTVPRPKIATMEPGSTFAVFQTAPRPKYKNCELEWIHKHHIKINFKLE